MSNSPLDWAVLLAVLLGITLVLGVGLVLLEQPGLAGRFARTRRWSVVGLAIVLLAVLISAECQGRTAASVAPTPAPVKAVSLAAVLRDVKVSDDIRTVPQNLIPPLSQVESGSNLGIPALSTGCSPDTIQSTVPACVFGDRSGSHTMVLYGDSHAGMWFDAIDDIATRAIGGSSSCGRRRVRLHLCLRRRPGAEVIGPPVTSGIGLPSHASTGSNPTS